MNRTTLVGRLTKDPELRYTPNGVAVATFTLAVNRTFTNQNGEREADFINCVAWRKTAENTANYLKKGSMAGVDGRLSTRNYENQQGQRVYVTEVQADTVTFLEPKNSRNQQQQEQPVGAGAGAAGNPNTNYNPFSQDPFANDGKPIEISDDDLPF